ncbi:hypothetical protein PoB_000860600 [Plakobranchus ocellatus]|uniref:Uncharacterized protein n=1 Tax=Plakobranchus ocellatus TaxID=259542 RepID=A0AAV3Y4E3_9GAST|nr:hypothetical protein PoB_000860600 [Plakobranchus ocellatus]
MYSLLGSSQRWIDSSSLMSPVFRDVHGDASRAVRDSRYLHRCGLEWKTKRHTSWTPGVHEREYHGPARGLMGANAVAGLPFSTSGDHIFRSGESVEESTLRLCCDVIVISKSTVSMLLHRSKKTKGN